MGRSNGHTVCKYPTTLRLHPTCLSECDISVSKLLGFETIPIVGMVSVSVSVSKIFGLKTKYRYRFRKKLVSKKVSVSVSKNFGIEKSIGIGFVKFWYRKKYRYRYRKKIGIEKSIGFGIGKIWYRKKVSDSVSFRFWVSSHTEAKLVFIWQIRNSNEFVDSNDDYQFMIWMFVFLNAWMDG